MTWARFAAVKDLPSLGSALVISNLVSGCFLARLIQAAAQGAELLHAGGVFFAAEKEHGLWVRSPMRLAAACEQGISVADDGDRGGWPWFRRP